MNNEVIKSNEDLIVGKTDYDPMGNMIYDSTLGKHSLAGGLTGAVIFGIIAFCIASGIIPIRDFGQFSTSGNGVATFVGACTGVAVGGLVGSLLGIKRLVAKNNKKGE